MYSVCVCVCVCVTLYGCMVYVSVDVWDTSCLATPTSSPWPRPPPPHTGLVPFLYLGLKETSFF